MDTYKTEDDVIKDAIKNKEPSVARDLTSTKMLLKQQSECGDNVYDHLSSLLSKVIDERPKNVMDYFEEYSRKVRKEKNPNSNPLLLGTYVEPEALKCANVVLKCLLKRSNFAKKDTQCCFTHLQFYWSLAGYGFAKGHVFALSCSIGVLENNAIIHSCRYWGRIFGLKLNYYIAEAELTDDEVKSRVDNDNDKQEQWGSGINQKTYFVTNCLSDEWVELPKLTTNEIEISEKISKFFTGDLNASIRSTPEFSGKEQNLLRAVIQRITTETFAAPVGFYTFDEGHEIRNSDYTPTESTKLLDLSLWNQFRKTNTPLCSEDSSNSIPPWTMRCIQEYFPEISLAIVRSNTWSGAVSFCSRREHDCLYTGWGVKYSNKTFIPPLPLTTEKEYDFNAKAANMENPDQLKEV